MTARVSRFVFAIDGPPLSMLERKDVRPCRICGRAPWLTRPSRQILTLLCNDDRHRMECSGWPMKATVDLWNACNP